MTTPCARTALFSLLLVLSPGDLLAASISGRVQLPKSKSAPVMNKRYEVVTKGGVIATNPPLGVVYLEGNFPPPDAPQVRQVIQKDLTFTPLLLPVRIGTKVEFPNLDETYHDVFSYSAPKRFDLGRYRSNETPTPSQTFDKPGLVTLRCDIHEHMRGLILVVNTPHFVVTDVEGRFQLTDLPAGSYTLKIWLDSKTTLERPVELQADSTLRLDLP
ncbi:MAG: carboxypeptidase regulatory-like domain-containing protein [Opitutaceae bacterium]